MSPSEPQLKNSEIEPAPLDASASRVPKTGVLAPGTILIENVSKRFKKHTVVKRSYTTIKSTLLQRFFQGRYPRDNYLPALTNLNVRIDPGKSLGVIGRNGSGKSTLLKLIAGIYRPDEGSVKVSGKISALIELGAGFHPDFSGRENIYLGGVMFGLSKKEIQAKFDDIVQYAELEDFIDDPVRTYSSGMYMRLGFSLAIHTDPDILLVDEVLAVGDAGFVHRCHNTISEFRRRGKTLIFVTHDLTSVERWCDEAIWLEKSKVRDRGEPRRVIDAYLERVQVSEEQELELQNSGQGGDDVVRKATTGRSTRKQADSDHRWGAQEVEILEVQMFGSDGESRWIFREDESVRVDVRYKLHSPVDDLVFGVGIVRADGVVVHGCNTDIDQQKIPIPIAENFQPGAEGVYRFHIDRLGLTEDSYFLDVAAHRSDGLSYDYHHLVYRFSVRSPKKYHGIYTPEHSWEFLPEYPANSVLVKAKV